MPGPPVCATCRAGQRCARDGCGKPIPLYRSYYLPGVGFVCGWCRIKAREGVICPKCGRTAQRLARARAHGLETPVCDTCRYQASTKRCPLCRKKTYLPAVDSRGRRICSYCRKHGAKPYVCPECGRDRIARADTRKCHECFCRDRAACRKETLAKSFSQGWVKNLFDEFYADARRTPWGAQLFLRLPYFAKFFTALDRSFRSPNELTNEDLYRIFGGKTLRNYERPHRFLIRCGYLPPFSIAARESSREKRIVQIFFEKSSGKWYEAELRRFHAFLQEVRRRFREADVDRLIPATIITCIRVTHRFLDGLDPGSIRRIQDLDTMDFVEFMSEKKVHYVPMKIFIAYLNLEKRLFKPVSLKMRRKFGGIGPLLPEATVKGLIRQWLSPEEANPSVALSGLLMILFVQSPRSLARMRLSSVIRTIDGEFLLSLGKKPVVLDARISGVLTRYLNWRRHQLAARRDIDNPYLFPGELPWTHMRSEHIAKRTKKQGVKASELRSSSLHLLFQHGFALPAVLAAGTGIHIETVMNYFYKTGGLLKPELSSMKETS